jgi:hypothetical protein
MSIKMNVFRKCKKCDHDERDHPVWRHFLYFEDVDGVDKIWDHYDTKELAEDILSLLISLHGMNHTYNVLKFKRTHESCNGDY